MKQKNLKIVAMIALNCVFALSAVAKNIAAVYEKFKAPDVTVKYIYLGNDTPKFAIENDAKYNQTDQLVFDGYYKIVFTGKEYAFTADTTVQNGKLNVTGAWGVYSDLKKTTLLTDTLKPNQTEIVLRECAYSKKEWTILSETQTICGKVCKKAIIKTDPVELEELKKAPEVGDKLPTQTIAWFCEELPYSVGPNGFDGLPGLIMKLETKTPIGYVDRYELTSYSFPDKIAIVQPQGKKCNATSCSYHITPK